MTQQKGIDVSEYQGVIDWAAVRSAGMEFAMLRSGYGRYDSQKDKRFEDNYAAAVQAGMPVGAYLFSYAVTPDQARQEAETYLGWLQGKQFAYPVAYDVETRAQYELGQEKLSDVIQAFCSVMEDNGYYVSLYSNLSFLRSVVSRTIRERYDIWLAQWATVPTYDGAFGMWQFSAAGSVPGVAGPVDLDVAYKDYPAIMRANGLNGFAAQPPVYAGQPVVLDRQKLYVSSTAPFHTARVSGLYYIYSVPAVHGRYRITNRPERVGRKPEWLNVTGWIDESALTRSGTAGWIYDVVGCTQRENMVYYL